MEQRLNLAFLTSAGLHGAGVGLYFFLSWHQQEAIKLLTDVELIEPEPLTQPIREPVAQRPPQSAWEFLKMALPTLKKTELQEVEKISKPKETLQMPQEKLLERKDPLFKKAEIRLEARYKASGANLAETLPSAVSSRSPSVSSLVSPDIKLEEVGRVAVSVPETPAIDLQAKRVVRSESLKEVASLPTSRAISRGLASAPTLVEKTGSVPSVAKSAGSLPLGYSRESGGAIALKTASAPVHAAPIAPTAHSSTEERSSSSILDRPKKKAVEMVGPVTGRKILSSPLPTYPEWARSRGVQADVAIRFSVSPDGAVRREVFLERTSGYRELDQLAQDAIRRWRFASVVESVGDQWGVITFRFILE